MSIQIRQEGNQLSPEWILKKDLPMFPSRNKQVSMIRERYLLISNVDGKQSSLLDSGDRSMPSMKAWLISVDIGTDNHERKRVLGQDANAKNAYQLSTLLPIIASLRTIVSPRISAWTRITGSANKYDRLRNHRCRFASFEWNKII